MAMLGVWQVFLKIILLSSKMSPLFINVQAFLNIFYVPKSQFYVHKSYTCPLSVNRIHNGSHFSHVESISFEKVLGVCNHVRTYKKGNIAQFRYGTVMLVHMQQELPFSYGSITMLKIACKMDHSMYSACKLSLFVVGRGGILQLSAQSLIL